MSSSDADWKLPWTAHCRCGEVAVRVSQPPIISMACHCTGCQRMSASAFSLSLAIPTAGFEVVSGKPVVGGLHGATRHMFCGHCMSWMYTHPEGLDFFVNLRATLLDDATWYVPWVETFTKEALPWAKTGARHSCETVPPESSYEMLMAEYAAEAPRPR